MKQVPKSSVLVLAAFVIALSPSIVRAQASQAPSTAQPGGDPWPRQTTAQNATISIYQPQLQSWDGNLLDAYAAVTIKTSGSGVTNYGVIWFTAQTEVDKVNRVVTLSDFKLTKQSFPSLADNGSAYTMAFQGDMPWTQSMPLDELETSLSTASIEQQQARVAVMNDPPRIIVSTSPAVLALIDGQPTLRAASGGLQKVVNTRALILFDAASRTYYLALMDGWVQATSIEGPWSLAANAPTAMLDQVKAAAASSNQNQVLGSDEQSLREAYQENEAPTVYVSTGPAELILTQGAPVFKTIPGTSLSYVSNTAADIFRDSSTQQNYVLIGGRWFSAPSLQDGPWSYQPAASLPAGFAQ